MEYATKRADQPTIWHDASVEMPDAAGKPRILFLNKRGDYRIGIFSYDRIWTAGTPWEQSDIKRWCYWKDALAILI